ncbi:MAG: UPF0175 family protein [Candidatus Heimdallarchaeota archaeon]
MKIEDILEDANPLVKITLVLLFVKNKERIRGKLWLQKELYMIAKKLEELSTEELYEAHYFGQFSEDAEVAIEQIAMLGLLEPRTGFNLSKFGEEVAEEAKNQLNLESIQFIEDVKEFLNDLEEDELLGYIYNAYPEMAENSVKKAAINQKRVEIAIQLYLKDKISLGKAVEIAGIDRVSLIDLIRGRDSSIEMYAE